MKVSISEDVLADPDVWDVLDRVIHHFMDRRHLWDIDDPDTIKESPWMQNDLQGRAGRRNLETFEKCFTDSAYPQPPRTHSISITITRSTKSDGELSPDDARRCLDTPAYVAVENEESDGVFLDAMIAAFRRKLLLNAQTDGWWKLEHLGGFGEVEKRVDHLRATTIGPLRVFVLTDSDSLYPGHVTQTITKIQDYCGNNRVPYANLKKRKTENYLPLEALPKTAGKLLRTYRAFKRLTNEQQSHYEMKSGFEADEHRHAIIPREQEALFEDVPPNVLDKLCGGFGKNVWKRFRSARDVISEDAVRRTCASDPTEIDRILDEIERLL